MKKTKQEGEEEEEEDEFSRMNVLEKKHLVRVQVKNSSFFSFCQKYRHQVLLHIYIYIYVSKNKNVLSYSF